MVAKCGHKPTGKLLTPRASASLRRVIYNTLQDFAMQKGGSTAWSIRDVADKHVAEQWPLLEGAR